MSTPIALHDLPAESDGDVEVSLVAPRAERGGQAVASRKPLTIASWVGVGVVIAMGCVAWARSPPGGGAAPQVVGAAFGDAVVQLAASPEQCQATHDDDAADCGEPGTTQAQCEEKGCCYDESNWHHWCWHPASSGGGGSPAGGSSGDAQWECSLDRQDEDCGHDGMTKEECEAKGCCYDESANKWCFPKSEAKGAGGGGAEQKDAKEDSSNKLPKAKPAAADGTCDKNGQLDDCGEPGITQQSCEDKGCCYDESADLWCFKKSGAAPATPTPPAPSSDDNSNSEDKADHEEATKEPAEEPAHEEDSSSKAHKEVSTKALPSLFCFSVLAGVGDDELVKTQESTGTGIFACDEWGKFTSNAAAGKEGEAARPSWALTDTFIAAWKLLKEDGRYKNHDYIVKLEVDTIFFPDRLRSWLSRNEPPQEDVYITSCKDSDSGLSSALEVFSKAAVHKYLDEIDSCREELEYDRWGEDMFTQQCMDGAGVGAWEFEDMICDKECSCDPAPCTFGKIGYHPFNKSSEYEQCIKDARR